MALTRGSVRKSVLGSSCTYADVAIADIATLPACMRTTIVFQSPIDAAALRAFLTAPINLLQPRGTTPTPGITYESDTILTANEVAYTVLARGFRLSADVDPIAFSYSGMVMTNGSSATKPAFPGLFQEPDGILPVGTVTTPTGVQRAAFSHGHPSWIAASPLAQTYDFTLSFDQLTEFLIVNLPVEVNIGCAPGIDGHGNSLYDPMAAIAAYNNSGRAAKTFVEQDVVITGPIATGVFPTIGAAEPLTNVMHGHFENHGSGYMETGPLALCQGDYIFAQLVVKDPLALEQLITALTDQLSFQTSTAFTSTAATGTFDVHNIIKSFTLRLNFDIIGVAVLPACVVDFYMNYACRSCELANGYANSVGLRRAFSATSFMAGAGLQGNGKLNGLPTPDEVRQMEALGALPKPVYK